ncbi:MAG TPA: NAD-dependent epimerase/dehydratase family protein [Polyangia bacterium]
MSWTVDELAPHYAGKRVLLTGANGFVAGHLSRRLHQLGALTFGVGRQSEARHERISYLRCDLRDTAAVASVFAEARPHFLFHLASQASVGTSWDSEWETIEANVRTTFNALKAIDRLQLPTRMLLVSSGEVYGDRDAPAEVGMPLRPLNPYAAAKAMMETLVHGFRRSSLSYVIARAFNHTGPGRPTGYFESSMAAQIAEAVTAGAHHVVLRTGNVDSVRDYSDVRDVADKYLTLAALEPSGAIHNVSSGRPITLREVIDMLAAAAGVTVETEVDPARLRRNDLPYLVGVNSAAGPERPLASTLGDLMSERLELAARALKRSAPTGSER